MCTHPINLMGIHLLHCAHGNKHTRTQDVICKTFVIITRDVGYHVGWEQFHAFLSNLLNLFCWWINIMFTKDGIRTLIDFLIDDLMWVDLVPQFYATQRFVVFKVVEAKEQNYHDWHLIDQFVLLVVEVFGCLHKHLNVFLYDHAKAIWSLRGPKGLHFFVLLTFIHQSHYKGCKHLPS
jgi:hypothetical protein